jgi:glycosyltransferase involved in cell wall biosynthesis
MSEGPLVSVVIPTWNRVSFVEEAVRSVIAQTYRNWELIVVDDGSTDGTVERLNALKDSRIRVLWSPHTGHIGQARNRGVAAGSGELIAFLDSDDVWLPQKLDVQLKALCESGVGWCYSRNVHMDAEGRPIQLRNYRFLLLSGDIVQELLTFRATVATSTVVVRRSVLDAAGRYSEHPRLLVNQDYEMYMRLALQSPVIALPDTLVKMRRHPGNTDERRVGRLELRALIYELFLASNPDANHARFARRLWTRSLADVGAQQLSAGNLSRAALLFGRSARHGADVRYWTRALARGLRDGVLRRGRAPAKQ